ncbi:hypothetical protein CFC35_10560 [Streptomyces sp. FBKL.4005]|nr:hypothetical protein CFC35_10560 [Streptomyces sp. FBKL.4005]
MHTDQCREPVGKVARIARVTKSLTECMLQVVSLKAVSTHIPEILHLYALTVLQLRKPVDKFSSARQRFWVRFEETLLV